MIRSSRVALAFLRCFGLFLLTIPVIVVGFPAVALALPFRKTVSPEQPFTQFPGNWSLVTLPSFAQPWDNIFDGALGDKRGWWNNYCQMTYGKPCTAFRSMWQWLAVRNSANHFKRVTCGVDVSDCIIALVAGQASVSESAGASFGWQLLLATRSDEKLFPRLLIVAPYRDGSHAFVVDIGWKVSMSHNGTTPGARIQDRLKGLVFLVSPYKTL